MTDATITNNNNSKSYLIYGIEDYSDDVSQTVYKFTLPDSSSEETILIRLEGQEETKTISFQIFNNNVDRANGTHTSEVKTIDEQIDYLKNEIFQYSMNADWTITNTSFASSGLGCTIEKMTFRKTGGDTNKVQCVMTLIVGAVQ